VVALRSFVFAAIALAAAGCGGGGGRPTGPPVPVPDTIRTITGRVAYFTTGPDLSGRDASGRLIPVQGFVRPTLPRPAPHVPVEVLNAAGTVLGLGLTDPNGDYSVTVNFGQNPAVPVAVRATARVDFPFGTTLRVLPNAFATEPYSHQTALGGDPLQAVMRRDLTIPLSANSGAYFILEALYGAFFTAKSGIQAPMPDLDVYWEPGNGARSVLDPRPDRAVLLLAGGVAGDPSSNTDEWDASKIVRLMWRYLLAYFFNDVAPDGEPNGALLIPSAAWREGFLDFWACAGRGTAEFVDTKGSGTAGHVVRFFRPESFFDPALGSLGPDDPNVYQAPNAVGIGSPYTVAELLWDIHDAEGGIDPGDKDGIEFPLFLTLRLLEGLKPGSSYPYLFSLLDEYVRDGSIKAVLLDILMRKPEDQGMVYPGTGANGLAWPAPIEDAAQPGAPVAAPFDKTMVDEVDTVTPNPVNFEIGILSQRYFIVNLAGTATLTATLSTTGDLAIDLLDLSNALLATGTSSLVASGLESGRYVLRVRPVTNPQHSSFELRVQLQ